MSITPYTLCCACVRKPINKAKHGSLMLCMNFIENLKIITMKEEIKKRVTDNNKNISKLKKILKRPRHTISSPKFKESWLNYMENENEALKAFLNENKITVR